MKEVKEGLEYQSYNYLEVAEMFDNYFTQSHFKTTRQNEYRERYEVTMAQIDFWINIQNLGLSNDFVKDGQRFKNAVFYHLKKMGWKPTKIKGRWEKLKFL